MCDDQTLDFSQRGPFWKAKSLDPAPRPPIFISINPPLNFPRPQLIPSVSNQRLLGMNTPPANFPVGLRPAHQQLTIPIYQAPQRAQSVTAPSRFREARIQRLEIELGELRLQMENERCEARNRESTRQLELASMKQLLDEVHMENIDLRQRLGMGPRKGIQLETRRMESPFVSLDNYGAATEEQWERVNPEKRRMANDPVGRTLEQQSATVGLSQSQGDAAGPSTRVGPSAQSQGPSTSQLVAYSKFKKRTRFQ
ncbi:hypothetical protein Ocin01_13729 [Orchesella cincta]|uniref:Uncharacterized protein n=1 Tax=Orchesella cincta TaxID=48709 RepID=A0A1D2MJ06_ORCCI|nr:hypothetical protein Ocin01_13729 [Orchesella cincta]